MQNLACCVWRTKIVRFVGTGRKRWLRTVCTVLGTRVLKNVIESDMFRNVFSVTTPRIEFPAQVNCSLITSRSQVRILSPQFKSRCAERRSGFRFALHEAGHKRDLFSVSDLSSHSGASLAPWIHSAATKLAR